MDRNYTTVTFDTLELCRLVSALREAAAAAEERALPSTALAYEELAERLRGARDVAIFADERAAADAISAYEMARDEAAERQMLRDDDRDEGYEDIGRGGWKLDGWAS